MVDYNSDKLQRNYIPLKYSKEEVDLDYDTDVSDTDSSYDALSCCGFDDHDLVEYDDHMIDTRGPVLQHRKHDPSIYYEDASDDTDSDDESSAEPLHRSKSLETIPGVGYASDDEFSCSDLSD